MLATIRTFALLGLEAREVVVEVDVRRGLPTLTIVGLPDRALRESRERVRAAIANSGYEFPLKRITVNLAPASLRKAGPGFDLAIAAAVLVASEQISASALEGCALVGELALDGSVRALPGSLSMAEEAARLELRRLAIAASSAAEALLALQDLEDAAAGRRPASGARPRVTPLSHLRELASIGSAEEPAEPSPSSPPPPDRAKLPDLRELRGQPLLRRALEIAAAGGHGLLMVGPPGAGKSLAARRFPSLLPPLGGREALEVRRIASACGAEMNGSLMRPFRAPHHTISAAGLVGGGSPPQAGEVTLAHRGVLFLDELAEFPRAALEALRQPLEEGTVAISRAHERVELPCRFQLLAAANPCPCGRGEDSPRCSCDAAAVRRYAAKLSGALADRLDIVLGLGQPDPEALGGAVGEASARVRDRVASARRRQATRLGSGRSNSEMGPEETHALALLDPAAGALLHDAHRRLELSGRGHDRVLRVARTIADLDGCENVGAEHVAEALSLRAREPR